MLLFSDWKIPIVIKCENVTDQRNLKSCLHRNGKTNITKNLKLTVKLNA